MHSAARWLGAATLGAALTLAPVDADAQQQQRRPGQAPAASAPVPEVTLVYQREIFAYRAGGRRDPFVPLTDDNEMGPRFEDLTLQGIIYSTGQGRSLALLGGREGRIYRVRVGDVVGNARVIEIGPLRVVLAVETFGVVRQEMLELRRNQGDNR